jgi:hypothetical protein
MLFAFLCPPKPTKNKRSGEQCFGSPAQTRENNLPVKATTLGTEDLARKRTPDVTSLIVPRRFGVEEQTGGARVAVVEGPL